MKFFSQENIIECLGGKYSIRTSNDIFAGGAKSVVVKDGKVRFVRYTEFNTDEKFDNDKETIRLVHSKYKEQINTLIETSNNMPDQMESAYWRNYIGYGFSHFGMYEQAVIEYEKVIRSAPSNGIAQNYLGRVLFKLGKTEDAIKLFHKAVKTKPEYADFHRDLAVAYLKLGKSDDAYDSICKALIINPYYADAYYLRAISVLVGLGNPRMYNRFDDLSIRIISDIKQAISLNPYIRVGSVEMVQEYILQGHYAEALKVLKKAPLDNWFYDFNYHKLKMYLYFSSSMDDSNTKDIISYVSYLEGKLIENPVYADIHYELGLANRILSNYYNKKAIEHFKNALIVNPEFVDARENLVNLEKLEMGTEHLLETIFK